jgi:hypothetical protein
MIENSLKEAFRLIGRSRKEVAIYMAASLVCGGISVLMCKVLGIDYTASDSFQNMKTMPIKVLAASIPGGIILAWFEAGLTGRVVFDAFKGELGDMTRYANGWFLRNLASEAIFKGISAIMVVAAFSGNKPGALIAGICLLAVTWLVFRVSLWLNASFVENLGLFQAMKRSYAVSAGNLWRLIILIIAPAFAADILKRLIVKLLPGQTTLVYILKDLTHALSSVVVIGALAAIYVALTATKTLAVPDAEKNNAAV